MSAEADALLAQLDTLIDKREADLAKALADDAADDAAVAAAQLARDQAIAAKNAALADDAADDATIARLRAQVVSLGGNPDGPTPPPVDTRDIVVTVHPTIPGRVDLKEVGFTADARRRNGGTPKVDEGWSGTIIGGEAPGRDLTSLQRSVATVWKVGMHDPVKGDWIEKDVTILAPVTPPNPSPTGLVNHSAFLDMNETGGIAAWENLVRHKLAMQLCYMLDSDTNALLFDSLVPYMRTHTSFRLLLGVNPLVDTPGQFESANVANRMRALGQKIAAYGQDIASRIIIRYAYEMNGDWMPWGRQFAGNEKGARYRAMWRAAWTAYHAVCPWSKWAWCFNFWDDNGIDPAGFYPGDDVVDFVTSDNYDAWLSGTPDQRAATLRIRLRAQVTFATAHGKKMGQDEYGIWASSSSQGGGDNPTYLRTMFTHADENDYEWLSYFDSAQGAVDTRLAQNPNSLAVYQQTKVLTGASA